MPKGDVSMTFSFYFLHFRIPYLIKMKANQSIFLSFMFRICKSYKIFRIQNHFTFVYENDLLSYTKMKRNSHG